VSRVLDRAWPVLDGVFLLRPLILVPAWTFLLAGRFRAGLAAGAPSPAGGLLRSMAAFTALMGAVHILNQLGDRESDRLNAKVFLLSEGYVSVRRAVAIAVVLVAAAGGLAIGGNRAQRVLLGASLLLGLAYSMPPLRWKARAGWDLVANALGFGALAFAVGWTSRTPYPAGLAAASLPYVCAAGALFVLTTLPDRAGDSAAGDRTLGVVLGERSSAMVALALTAACAGLGYRAGDHGVTVVAVILLPVIAVGVRRPRRALHLAGTRLGVLLFSVMTAVRYPWLAPWLAIVVGGSRWYHHRRFGVSYPALRSD
jgi:4-hydroxybenzoate polyprenyltransferase